MAEQKMDFMDFIAQNNAKYGTSDEDWEYYAETSIVRFDDNGFDKISGKHKGNVVFVDTNYANEVKPGEIWIVKLNHSNKLTSKTLYAKPIQRVDASFMYELRKDQLDEISEYLWNEHRSILEPILEEKYADTLKDQIDKAIDEVRSDMKDEMDRLRSSVDAYEKTTAEDRQIIESKEKEISELRLKIESLQKTKDATSAVTGIPKMSESPEMKPFKEAVPNKIPVYRIGPDSISSEYFNKSRYFVHISLDHKLLVLHPHTNGDVVCIDNTIELDGLNLLSPFDEVHQAYGEYNPLYNGVQIHLG